MILALLASLLAAPEQGPLRSVEIWSEHPIRLTIEWLTIDDEGRADVTAKALMAVGPPVPIEFRHEPGRYLRISYEGASPRTYSTTELVTRKRLPVPGVLPGGELLLVAPQAAVRPRELRVAGPLLRTMPLEGALHVSMSGVPPGEYRVVPVYEGGIEGRAREAVVTATASTVLLMPVEDVGAVQIESAPEVCNPATLAGLNRLGPLDPKKPEGPIVRGQVHLTKEPRCWMTFGGLRAGPFEVFYQQQESMLGRARFAIEPQQVTRVHVRPAAVTVTGRVTLNGKPVAGTRVRFVFSGEGGDPSLVSATTDAAGHYAATLMRAGRFLAVAESGVSRGEGRQVDIADGANVVDFAITGGAIAVQITGWTGPDRVQLRLEGPGRMTVMSWPKDQGPARVFGGLPPGSYKLSASIGGRQYPENVKTVTVGAAGSEVRVTFDLSKR